LGRSFRYHVKSTLMQFADERLSRIVKISRNELCICRRVARRRRAFIDPVSVRREPARKSISCGSPRSRLMR